MGLRALLDSEGLPKVANISSCSHNAIYCLKLSFLVFLDLHRNLFVQHLFNITRKYPLCGYILGVLTHTTAWDRNWGGDETLKLVLV